MILQELVSEVPVQIISVTTGKILRRSVTAKSLECNPQLATLHILGVQTATLLAPCNQFTCWVDEQEYNNKK